MTATRNVRTDRRTGRHRRTSDNALPLWSVAPLVTTGVAIVGTSVLLVSPPAGAPAVGVPTAGRAASESTAVTPAAFTLPWWLVDGPGSGPTGGGPHARSGGVTLAPEQVGAVLNTWSSGRVPTVTTSSGQVPLAGLLVPNTGGNSQRSALTNASTFQADPGLARMALTLEEAPPPADPISSLISFFISNGADAAADCAGDGLQRRQRRHPVRQRRRRSQRRQGR